MQVIREAKRIDEPRFEVDDCLGCKDCKGICREILQLLATPATPCGYRLPAGSLREQPWRGRPQ